MRRGNQDYCYGLPRRLRLLAMTVDIQVSQSQGFVIVMHAIILAGGLGTRLQSINPGLPKPMAPVQGKPFLAYLLDYLAMQGITRVTLSVCYMWQVIQDHFKSSYAGIMIDYVVEAEPLGTGGAIVNAFNHLGIDQPVFVLNGDTLVRVDYRQMYQSRREGQRLMMGLCTVPDSGRYGRVAINDKIVTVFETKGKSAPGLINAGVYLIHPDIFKPFELPLYFSFENDFLRVYLAALKPAAFMIEGYFIDIGIPEDFVRIQTDIPSFIS